MSNEQVCEQLEEGVTSDTYWQRSEDWVGAQVEDRFVMVSIENGTYVSLNETADAVWKAIETPRTAQEICAAMQSEFDVAAPGCSAAVARALARMREIGIAAPV